MTFSKFAPVRFAGWAGLMVGPESGVGWFSVKRALEAEMAQMGAMGWFWGGSRLFGLDSVEQASFGASSDVFADAGSQVAVVEAAAEDFGRLLQQGADLFVQVLGQVR